MLQWSNSNWANNFHEISLKKLHFYAPLWIKYWDLHCILFFGGLHFTQLQTSGGAEGGDYDGAKFTSQMVVLVCLVCVGVPLYLGGVYGWTCKIFRSHFLNVCDRELQSAGDASCCTLDQRMIKLKELALNVKLQQMFKLEPFVYDSIFVFCI